MLILNWYDDERFVPPSPEQRATARRSLELDASAKVAVIVGNCSDVKNHRLAIDAIASLDPPARPVLLHLGDEQADAERQRARQLGLEPWMRFLGVQDDIVPALHAADLYLMPSRYEGLGIAAVEALGTGLRAVLTDVPGLRDLSVLGEGIVLSDLTVDHFAEAITRELDRPYARFEGTTRAARVQETFGAKRGVDEFVALYRHRCR